MPHSYTSSITHVAESEEVDVPKDKIEETLHQENGQNLCRSDRPT